jgi:predicted dithiol-disulfide oxidoreductase (DUF899 family)
VGSPELPGFSCFLRDAGAVLHTYSSYGRGGEQAGIAAYSLPDLTALGRQQDCEERRGRAGRVYPPNPAFLTERSRAPVGLHQRGD